MDLGNNGSNCRQGSLCLWRWNRAKQCSAAATELHMDLPHGGAWSLHLWPIAPWWQRLDLCWISSSSPNGVPSPTLILLIHYLLGGRTDWSAPVSHFCATTHTNMGAHAGVSNNIYVVKLVLQRLGRRMASRKTAFQSWGVELLDGLSHVRNVTCLTNTDTQIWTHTHTVRQSRVLIKIVCPQTVAFC